MSCWFQPQQPERAASVRGLVRLVPSLGKMLRRWRSLSPWRIAKQVPAAKAVAAVLQRSNIQIVRGDINIATTVVGTDLNYPAMKNIQPQLGTFFRQEDLDNAKPVVVLGAKVRDDLFSPSETAVGTDIRIRGKRYRVIGVMEAKGSMGPQNLDDVVYVPLTSMSGQIVGNNALSGVAINAFWVESSDADQLEAAQFQVTKVQPITTTHRIGECDATDDLC
jgi:putative ABC transport system permease protein